ncbi:MAG: hypothetical protein JXA73_26110 [Acidobacteria bacterium]|nr:hypothetical protein [Acidobacteriota bacterium]
MISTKRLPSPNSSNQIETLRRRLDAWRKTHKPRSRIPTHLWNSAARVAGQCGLNRTAKALHLDYYDLKKRMNTGVVSQGPVPSFIELSTAAAVSVPECIIELESRNGAKMRIQIKGMGIPDLHALSSMFWRIKR